MSWLGWRGVSRSAPTRHCRQLAGRSINDFPARPRSAVSPYTRDTIVAESGWLIEPVEAITLSGFILRGAPGSFPLGSSPISGDGGAHMILLSMQKAA